MIEIELNGERRTVEDEQTVSALVEQLALAGKACAVAINREVVPRHLWPERRLKPHDKVDIVKAIGGG